MSEKEPLVRIEHLTKIFRMGSDVVKAVDDISFTIEKGEVFGLVGESGCGKTTTGRAIIKLYDITQGDIYFKGRRIAAGISGYRRRLRKSILNGIRAPFIALKQGGKRAFFKAVKEERKEIGTCYRALRAALHDHYFCDRDYVKERLSEAQTSDSESRRLIKKERLSTQIQMIFQDPIASLNPRMTVQEIIAEGLIIKGMRDKKQIDEQVFKMLELVGLLPEHAGRYPHEFSGGQRQRIGVARSIIMKPELIIADEPISALDVSIQAQVINLLNDLRREFHLTILFIAHDLSVVKYFSDRIGVMYFGKIVELASSDELFRHPLHPYTKSLLSAIPIPNPKYEKTRKRITYHPLLAHDYEQEGPTFQEVSTGHFVLCNSAEREAYRKELGIE